MFQVEIDILEMCKNASSINPVTKWDLMDSLHIGDADVRKHIGSLREQGFRVISNKVGYWLATPEEYKSWLPHYLSYANTIYERKRAMDNFTDKQLRMVFKEGDSNGR